MNGTMRYIAISIFLFLFFPIVVCAQENSTGDITATLSDSEIAKYGALAIDRSNGLYYGFGMDCPTLAEAEKKAIEECNKKGGKGSVVLSFSGSCCVAYRYIEGNVGMGYGWGIALTREEADKKAKKECAERSYSLPAPNHRIECSDPNAGELKVIYDAHDELKLILPGTLTDY